MSSLSVSAPQAVGPQVQAGEPYDISVIGGGIVGLATAWRLQQRYPHKRVLLLEKESQVGQHQTGHNSGVIHAGVYYAPGSLKADFCRRGLAATLAFCRDHDIAVEQCGKLLVATDELQLTRMQALFERCRANGIDAELLDQNQLQQREPNVRGLGAIWVPSSGIVDYGQICRQLSRCFIEAGGELRLQGQVTRLAEDTDGITIDTATQTIRSRYLVACCGLQADRVTAMLDIPTDFQIVPFRGEYYQLPKARAGFVKHLIYPIPDPELPFLGVHLTPMIDGSISVGPNAVLGWQREGYGRLNFSWRDSVQMLSFRGFWPLLKQHWRSGLSELRDAWCKRGYLRRLQKYSPGLMLEDLQPYPAGVRAQAVMKDGSLVHDFLFADSPRSLHVCNAPSPAATSALPIAEHIVDKLSEKLASGLGSEA